MKQILCPTDFSSTAHNAIAYAAKLAQVLEARLVLLNVQSIFELMPQGAEKENRNIRFVADSLQEQSREVSKAFRISCYAEVQPASASLTTTIAEKGKEYDLIVMGTNGPDDVYQFLTGSNAYNASIKSSVPVLLVPEGCSYSEIKTVVYAFDYLRERKLPLAQLKPWVKAFGSELSVLQVMEEAYSEEAEDELKELQFISQTLYAEDIKLTFDTIRSYEIAESIHSYVLRTAPDMLALCAVRRNLLERMFHNSLIRNISTVSTYPVFIFHK